MCSIGRRLTADLIQRHSLPGQHNRVANGERDNQGTELDPRRLCGDMGERDHQLGRGLPQGRGQREMVRAIQPGEAKLLHCRDPSLPQRPRHPPLCLRSH
jgi:hypothetical protein